MKILLTQFGNETNSFAVGKTTFETLVPNGWVKGEDVIGQFKGTATYLGGAPGDGTHFRGYFQSRADAIVTADPPGQCPINLKLYRYKNVEHPILPLEEVDSI